MSAVIRVTATDLGTGKSDALDITDDFVVVTTGTAQITSRVDYANGTSVITIKGRSSSPSPGEQR